MKADDTRMPMLQGRFRVPHFDAKAAEADGTLPACRPRLSMVSFYWDNLYLFALAPKKDDKGVYSWAFPMGDAKLAGIAKDDIGKAAYGVFKAGPQHRQDRRDRRRARLVRRRHGREAQQGLGIGPVASAHVALDANLFRSFGFPGADEYGNMFQVYRDFEKEVNAVRSVDENAQAGRRFTAVRSTSGWRTTKRP